MVHDRGGDSVKVVIEGTAKEIASLVLELQERHGAAEAAEVITNKVQQCFRDQLGDLACSRWWERVLNENWEPGDQTKYSRLFGTGRSGVDTDGYKPGSCAEAHRATQVQVRRRIYSRCQHQKEDP